MHHSTLQNMARTAGSGQLGKTQVDSLTGVQYNFVSLQNEQRYRILDEKQLIEERVEIDEARALIMSMQKDPSKKEGLAVRTDKAGKDKKAAANAFEDAMLTKQITGVDPVAAEALRKLLAKDEEEIALVEGPEPEFARNATHAGSWSHIKLSGLGVPQEGTSRYSMQVIKDKFHDNVDLIEQLYHEKEALKARVGELEEDLIDPERAAWIVRASKYGLPVTANHHSHHPHSARGASREKSSPRASLSPRTHLHSARDHTRASRAKKGEVAVTAAEMAMKLLENKEKAKGGPGKNLVADMDRYLQKRRALELQEEAAAKQKESDLREFEERERKKMFNAKYMTKNSLEGVERRNKEFQEYKKDHLEQLRKEQQSQEQQQREKFSKDLKDHIKKGPVEQELTYDAQLEQEAIQRKERIERRKTELLFSSKALIDYDPLKKRFETPEPYHAFLARDPTAVMEKLDLQSLKWQNHLEMVKEKQREVEKAQQLHYMGTSLAAFDPTISMNARQAESDARREARLERSRKAEAARDARQLARHKRDVQKMANAPQPQSGRRLTAAAEKRASLIRDKIEAEKAREAEHLRKSVAHQKENEVLLTNLRQSVSAQETYRKTAHGNFVDISGNKAAEKAEATARESRERARLNKQRLQDSLSRRVYLYDRHKLEQEKQAAADRALGIVKDALVGAAVVNAPGKENTYYLNEKKKMRSSNDSKAESKGGARSNDGFDGYDAKMLELDPKQLAHDVMNELLDGKEKWKLGMRDAEVL